MKIKNNNNIADFIWHFLCITIPAMTIISIIASYLGNAVVIAACITILCVTRIVSGLILLALIKLNVQYVKEEKKAPKEIYMTSSTWCMRPIMITFFIAFGAIGINMFYSEILAVGYLMTACIEFALAFTTEKLNK